jgi:hypothetical protein
MQLILPSRTGLLPDAIFRLPQAMKKIAAPIFSWKPPFSFEFFCRVFLRHRSALKEMNDDRNHRK